MIQTTPLFQMRNQGGLVIPSEFLKDWGYELLSVVRANFDIDRYGNHAIDAIRKVVRGDATRLKNLFDSAWKSIVGDGDERLELRNKAYTQMTSSITNARCQVVIRGVHERYLSRTANRRNGKNSQMTIRTILKSIKKEGAKKMVEDLTIEKVSKLPKNKLLQILRDKKIIKKNKDRDGVSLSDLRQEVHDVLSKEGENDAMDVVVNINGGSINIISGDSGGGDSSGSSCDSHIGMRRQRDGEAQETPDEKISRR